MLIAIPSDTTDGLDSPVSEHFGHCAAFTLVTVTDDTIGEVSVLENGGHDDEPNRYGRTSSSPRHCIHADRPAGRGGATHWDHCGPCLFRRRWFRAREYAPDVDGPDE